MLKQVAVFLATLFILLFNFRLDLKQYSPQEEGGSVSEDNNIHYRPGDESTITTTLHHQQASRVRRRDEETAVVENNSPPVLKQPIKAFNDNSVHHAKTIDNGISNGHQQKAGRRGQGGRRRQKVPEKQNKQSETSNQEGKQNEVAVEPKTKNPQPGQLADANVESEKKIIQMDTKTEYTSEQRGKEESEILNEDHHENPDRVPEKDTRASSPPLISSNQSTNSHQNISPVMTKAWWQTLTMKERRTYKKLSKLEQEAWRRENKPPERTSKVSIDGTSLGSISSGTGTRTTLAPPTSESPLEQKVEAGTSAEVNIQSDVAEEITENIVEETNTFTEPIAPGPVSDKTPEMTKAWWQTLDLKQRRKYKKLSEVEKKAWRRENMPPAAVVEASTEKGLIEEAAKVTTTSTDVPATSESPLEQRVEAKTSTEVDTGELLEKDMGETDTPSETIPSTAPELVSDKTPKMTKAWWQTLTLKQRRRYKKLSEVEKEAWRRENMPPATVVEASTGKGLIESAEVISNVTTVGTGHQSDDGVSTAGHSWRPTHEWLNSCAAELATNKTGIIVPYFTKRDGYGLGDCIKMCARCTLARMNRKDQNLALQYRSRACYADHKDYRSGGNLDIVEELLERYKQKFNPPEPPQDAIVLHLRVGDVIDRSRQSTEKLLIEGGDPFHTEEFKTSIKSVYEYLDNLESSGATNVVVVGGVFQRKFYTHSRVYQGCLERAFNMAGYDVTMIMDSGEADQDFYYMTRSKKFIVSSGGFSSLISKLVVRNGGEVVGRTFDDPEAVAKYERKMVKKQQERWQKKQEKWKKTQQEQREMRLAKLKENNLFGGGSIGLTNATFHASAKPSNTTTRATQAKHSSIGSGASRISSTTHANLGTSAIGTANPTLGTSTSTTNTISTPSTKVINPDRTWRPSREWMQSCVAELQQNKTGLLKPFVSWRNRYGLGDCIKMCARCKIGKKNNRDHNLALQYLGRACDLNHPNYVSGGNLTIVETLLKEFGKNQNYPPLPSPDALVIHLRVGDVIEKSSQQSTTELLLKGGDPLHTEEFKSSIKSVYEYLDNIDQSNATQVVIVGGAFKQHQFEKSRVYAGCLERAIQHAGYNVSMDLDAPDADYDFYYMTHSKKLVVSAGGYSALIAKLVVRNGGQVIGRTFDDPKAVANYERKKLKRDAAGKTKKG